MVNLQVNYQNFMKTHVEKAWEFWKQFGDNPICLAPMAEVNDLAFRLQCRLHNVKVCYTGMINSNQWIQGHKYQNRVFQTCQEDRPLIVQLAGSDYDTILSSAVDIGPLCDAVDLNLGCTQHIAKRGGYGFFLVDTAEKRDEVIKLFEKLSTNVCVPVTAKIRIFTKTDEENNEVPDPETTIEFAKQLQNAGVSVLAVHGRFQHRDKKANVFTDIIKKVVETVEIPVIANGGVNSKSDAIEILRETGAAGVMVGQALLANPTIFDNDFIENESERTLIKNTNLDHNNESDNKEQSNEQKDIVCDSNDDKDGRFSLRTIATEYLELAAKHPEKSLFYAKKHMFKFYESKIRQAPGTENKIKEAQTIEDLLKFVNEM
ncbi:dihydrouridine synthase [Tritrichomonas foetus]|uniref:tRNA-dihydrouridine synthase n=1 Tax=Tritrichomonas foetus TaxID=1144522 RepID=A0A1J4J9M7_9EUKA|nr:dihydrouridine synthase [Tritrichomonas foetus]|eukprot:OHS95894.1 dihydrouridine synthase [Tritrichomonas foetus]